MNADELPELITTRELADLTGRSVSTINRWVLDHRITPVKKIAGRTGGYIFRTKDVAPIMVREELEQLSPLAWRALRDIVPDVDHLVSLLGDA